MGQQYTDRTALQRMSVGLCPECGHGPQRHDGWGGPEGCTLTDSGVSQRIYEHQRTAVAGGADQ